MTDSGQTGAELAEVPLLDVDGLTVRLPVDGAQRAVLRDISLTVRAGEAVGLVGESGSGKSMTARAIDRLLPGGAQVEGQIRYRGRTSATWRAQTSERSAPGSR